MTLRCDNTWAETSHFVAYLPCLFWTSDHFMRTSLLGFNFQLMYRNAIISAYASVNAWHAFKLLVYQLPQCQWEWFGKFILMAL